MIWVTDIYVCHIYVTNMYIYVTNMYIYVTNMYIYVTYMSGTYIAINVKYMYKQHHTIADLWYECEYFNMCIHINDSYYVYY